MLRSGHRLLQFIRRRTRYSTKLIFVLLLCFLITFLRVSSINSDLEPRLFQTQKKIVNDKKDLLKADITKELQNQYRRGVNLDHGIRSELFVREKVVGFVSNLDLNKLKLHSKKNSGNRNNNDNDIDVNQFRTSETYDSVVTCEDLKYENELAYRVLDRNTSKALVGIRRQVLNENTDTSRKAKNDDLEKGLTDLEIVNKFWSERDRATVWLENEQCYLTFSQVVYNDGRKDSKDVSFIRGAAYDKNWEEIVGKMIKYNDMEFPDDIEKEYRELEKQLSFTDCANKKFINSLQREECRTNQNYNRLKNMKLKETILSDFFVTYPYILDIQSSIYEKIENIENLRVLLRPNRGSEEEPLLILDHKVGNNRAVSSYFPHRKTTNLIDFQMEAGEDMGGFQNNWAPFNHPTEDTNLSELSNGNIHLVQTFSPLRILSCSLDDGLCEKIFNGDTLELSKEAKDDSIRGGTQFVSLPDVLPNVKGKNIWVSFTKTHIDKCGCGDRFYRPALTVMIEADGVYHLELIVPGMGFTIAPLNSQLKATDCKGDNILIADSIISWYIASQDKSHHRFDDYMKIGITESGKQTKHVIVRGLLNYILEIYKVKNIKDTFEIDKEANVILGKTRMCVTDYSFEVCRRYGLRHHG